MRVFITGAAGFLGSAMARHFRALGWTVCGSSHDGARLRELSGLLDEAHVMDFFGAVSPDPFEACDAVVHCAYDARPGAAERNLAGAKAFHAAALQAGVPYQLFVSSHSARPDAVSEYGRLKFRQETYFLDLGQAVVRPGLIVGDGGLYAGMARSIARAPFLLLPGADRSPVFFIALGDLLTAITSIIEGARLGAYNLFFDPPATMREFSMAVAEAEGRRPAVLSVPLAPLFGLLGLMRPVRSFMPPSLGRLETLRQNVYEQIHVSDLRKFVPNPTSLVEAVRQV